jgi:hypothetical protein
MAHDFEHPVLNSLHLELMSNLCHCCASHWERYEEDNSEKYCIQTKQYVTLEGQMRTKKSALLGYYAASSGNFLPTFRDNLSVSSSTGIWILEP